MKLVKFFTLFAMCCLPAAAHADETITYSYDARGVLIKVEHAGTINSGIKTEYSVDKAENRTNITVTGAPT